MTTIKEYHVEMYRNNELVHHTIYEDGKLVEAIKLAETKSKENDDADVFVTLERSFMSDEGFCDDGDMETVWSNK